MSNVQNETLDNVPTGAAEAVYTITDESTGQVIGTVPSDLIEAGIEEARPNRNQGNTFPDERFFEIYRTLSDEGKRYLRIGCLFIITAAKTIIEGGAVDYSEIRAQLPEEFADLLIDRIERDAPGLRAKMGTVEGGTDDAKS